VCARVCVRVYLHMRDSVVAWIRACV